MRFLTIIFFLMTGCATTHRSTFNYTQYIDAWVGKSEKELFNRWGKPEKIKTESDGIEIITYYHSEITNENESITDKPKNEKGMSKDTASNGVSGSHGGGKSNYTSGDNKSSSSKSHKSCITYFTIHNGEVEETSWDGIDCKPLPE